MTTIAYKDGILAADSQLTVGKNIKMDSDPKIYTLPNGVILAPAGDSDKITAASKFFSQPDWEDKIDEAPNFKKGFEALVVSKGRIYYCFNNCIVTPMCHRFFALGSGWQIANAAMHSGLSAEEAVKFASELDIYTNNKVQLVNVQDVLEKEGFKRTRGSSKRKALPQA